jgi:hypothetical protein
MADLLNAENFRLGFLLDEELMGGVTELKAEELTSGEPERYLAYVLRHTTGEYLGQRRFTELADALSAMNQIVRPWRFERTKACGGSGLCATGNCAGGGCKVQKVASQGPCESA